MSAHRLQTGLHARAEQQLLLQPRLLQSIEVLQVPAQDLEGWLLEAAEANEALRVELPGPGAGRGSREASEAHDEFLRNQPQREAGLVERLEDQLALLELDDELETWLRFLIGCLDENGYLSVADEELLALAAEAGLEPEAGRLGRAIARLQRLEPRGIGGRDMVEALLLQLDERAPDYELLCRLLEEFLGDLAANRLPKVARALGLELDELALLLEQLRGLEPRPGAELAAEEAPALRADVVVERDERGGFEVRLERSNLPSVSVDPEVATLAKEGDSKGELRSWARERVERARWIVDAVAQRGETLLRVARETLARQAAFLEHGPGHLAPLTMGEVAEALELHLSTVSRAVSGKHVQGPFGILPLRSFFQVATGSSEAPARDDLGRVVRSIFEGEDPRNPLSDEEVAEELARRGHRVARRTVAKHRRQLGIASSYKRRKYT